MLSERDKATIGLFAGVLLLVWGLILVSGCASITKPVPTPVNQTCVTEQKTIQQLESTVEKQKVELNKVKKANANKRNLLLLIVIGTVGYTVYRTKVYTKYPAIVAKVKEFLAKVKSFFTGKV